MATGTAPRGEEADGPQGLARGLDLNVDAAAEDVVLILQGQGAPAAAEEVGEGLGKGGLDLGKLPAEDGLHLPGDAVDDPLQLLAGNLHVGLLVGEVAVALLHPLVLLQSPQVHGAQGLDGPVELGGLALGLGGVLHRLAEGQGSLVGEAVGVPQPVQQALFLQVGLELFLLQGPALPLQAPAGCRWPGGRARVILRPGLVQGPLGLEAGLPLGSQGLAGLFQGGDLLAPGWRSPR